MNIDNRISDQSGELQRSLPGMTGSKRSVTSTPRGGSSGTGGATRAESQAAAVVSKHIEMPSKEIDARKAVEVLSDLVSAQRKDVAFSVDENADATVIKFYKKDTGELIKQIPPEEVLAMRSRMRDTAGLLVDERA